MDAQKQDKSEEEESSGRAGEKAPTVETLQSLLTEDPEGLYKTFQRVLTALKSEIDKLATMDDGSVLRKDASDELLAKISSLSNWIVDVGPKLSTRDQEGYSNHVRALQNQLRTATNPPKKSRFKFKSRPVPPVAVTTTAGSSSASSPSIRPTPMSSIAQKHKQGLVDKRHLHFSLPNAIDSDSDIVPTDRPPAPTSVSRCTVAPDDHSVIADEVGKTLDLPSSKITCARPVTLNGLHDCVVRNMSDSKIPTLYLRKMRGCVIDGGWVSGSVFIEDVADSVIFVRARQVRVHETRKSALVVDVRSQPVVEDCSGVKFLELDSNWVAGKYGEETEGGKNHWDEVLDFKWHKEGHSPNWEAMGSGEDGKGGKGKIGKEDLEKYLRTDWPRMDILKAAGLDVRRGSMTGVQKPPVGMLDPE
ncbi:putative tubulin folding cofactor C [Zalerion maritima]|uniref:Tubulin folding cofactor C n=1 Tax=Zalerion maritima TaxID=339359 RepID=A0AAD5RNT9_9PEZI|nr:putative tubulin folding cofactor C [Zalerion maritima]